MIKQNQIKKEVINYSNQKPNHIKFKFSKSRVLVDAEKTILVCLTANISSTEPAVWLPMRLLYTSEWTEYITAYIPSGFTFPVINQQSGGEFSGELNAETLRRLLADDYL